MGRVTHGKEKNVTGQRWMRKKKDKIRGCFGWLIEAIPQLQVIERELPEKTAHGETNRMWLLEGVWLSLTSLSVCTLSG